MDRSYHLKDLGNGFILSFNNGWVVDFKKQINFLLFLENTNHFHQLDGSFDGQNFQS